MLSAIMVFIKNGQYYDCASDGFNKELETLRKISHASLEKLYTK